MIELATELKNKTLTVSEAIQSRRSIRSYKQEPIPKEHIQEILELVRLTPSAWNLQPWRIHVVTDNDIKAKLHEAAYGQKQVAAAQALFIVASDMEDVIATLAETIHPDLPEERKKDEEANLAQYFNGLSIENRGQWGLTQANIALGFLLLAIQGLGYSSTPMLGFDQQKVREILQIPEHALFAGMVSVGIADGEGHPHHRHTVDRIALFH